MYEYVSLPRARQDGLLEEVVGEELLLYDRSSHTAHCLSPVAACVWRRCDGERDVAELAELTRISEDLVLDALHELREKELLDAEPVLMQNTVPGESRREAIIRVGRVGAGAAAASLIVSASAATPAMASSGLPCAPLWKATTTYGQDALVEWPASSIECWGSLKVNNKGNEPAITSEWWEKVI
jgi:hypothetical protein